MNRNKLANNGLNISKEKYCHYSIRLRKIINGSADGLYFSSWSVRIVSDISFFQSFQTFIVMLKWRNPTVKECIFVVVVFAIVTAMLIPTCDLRSKKTVNHSRVIKIIKKFKQDQMSYFNKFGKYSSYEEVKSSYPILGRNEYGYDFIYEADNTSFRIWAIPKNYGKDGDLSFYADNIKGFIYGADHQGEKADANDSKVDSLP